VIIDDADQVKVTDFGIARAGASDMTETGSIMGTAQYLSPEQAQGHAVSASSDLYSVGIVLYELLTGRVPFDADSAVTIALKHVSEAPTGPTMINPGIPASLAHVVMWTLNKNPADRPKNADELIVALENAKTQILSGDEGQRTAAFGALPAEAEPAAAAVSAEELAVVGGPPPPDDLDRRRWRWIGLLVALLAVGGIAAGIYFLTRPSQKVVPPVVGEQLDTARTVLQNAGFQVSVVNEHSTKPAGVVFAQSPLGDTKADEGSTVQLTVSTGPPKPGPVNVPNVIGEQLNHALRDITHAGLKTRVISQASNQPANTVINQTPNAGQSVPPGSTVALTVSNGKVTVPDVVGKTESDAKSALANAGFNSTSTMQSSSQPPGTVISQTPAGGSQADPSSTTVSLVIAQQMPAVPNVVGQRRAAAKHALETAGFKVTVTEAPVTDPAQNDLVQSQTPSAGSQAAAGSTVTITVGHFTPPTTTTTTTTTKTT
jgi:serine/threonine-protein kinase